MAFGILGVLLKNWNENSNFSVKSEVLTRGRNPSYYVDDGVSSPCQYLALYAKVRILLNNCRYKK